jgi:hypothetical protein
MLLQSRKWRMIIRAITLVVTSMLMLAFAGPVSYALQDDTPRPITGPGQLLDSQEPVRGTYVNVQGLPDLDRAFARRDGNDLYYWIPVRGYDNLLVVRTDDPTYVFPHDSTLSASPASPQSAPRPVYYAGKVSLLKDEAGSKEIMQELARRGIVVDEKRVMVLLQGETPGAYRPMVPVMPVLAWLWLAALIGLVQIWRGRRPRYRPEQTIARIRT